MSSVWDIKKTTEKTNLVKELTDEIKEIRLKNKEFQNTNNSDYYVTLVFSCKDDRDLFLKNNKTKPSAFVDGYKFAESIGSDPVKSSMKLPKPLNK